MYNRSGGKYSSYRDRQYDKKQNKNLTLQDEEEYDDDYSKVSRSRKKGTEEELDTYVSVGTEQPVDLQNVKAKDKNKYLPVWKQEIRDERGRKRLHGAFTGGFSAGYFNTVGSKEGWEPSQFVSSRNSRAQQSSMKPEDFMDEDDLMEMTGGRKVQMKQDYDVFGSTERELQKRNQIVSQVAKESSGNLMDLTAGLAKDIVVPAKDTIGVKLMRLMGWREGQGIGPKSKKTQLTDIHASNHLFAPKDVSISVIEVKRDLYGLGYDPSTYAPELRNYLKAKNIVQSDQPRGPTSSSGFGVGIFEDDDDELVYDSVDKESRYHKVLAIELEEEDHYHPKQVKSMFQDNSLKMVHQKNIVGFDGRPALNGFVFALNVSVVSEWFPSPKIPLNWKPKKPFEGRPGLLETDRKTLFSVDDRSNILGEEKLTGPKRQHVDLFTIAKQETYVDKPLPTVTKDQALAALQGFKPFGNDLNKQNRYINFLEWKAGLLKERNMNLVQGMRETDVHHELVEFSKSAQIYRPLSSMIASRFTTASKSDLDISKEGSKDEGPLVDDSIKAAKINIYGSLTRTVTEWVPARLLCKRLNVMNPYPDRPDPGKQAEVDKVALNTDTMNMLLQGQRVTPSTLMMNTDRTSMSETRFNGSDEVLQKLFGKRDDDQIISQKEQEVNEEIEVYQRPSMDIFKAIFAESDDEDDTNSDADDGKNYEDKQNAKVVEEREDTKVSEEPLAEKYFPINLSSNMSNSNLEESSTVLHLPHSFKPVFRSYLERKENVVISSSKKQMSLISGSRRDKKHLKRIRQCEDNDHDGLNSDSENTDDLAIHREDKKSKKEKKGGSNDKKKKKKSSHTGESSEYDDNDTRNRKERKKSHKKSNSSRHNSPLSSTSSSSSDSTDDNEIDYLIPKRASAADFM